MKKLTKFNIIVTNLFICTCTFNSTEAGTIWQKHSADFNEISINQVVSHPKDEKIIFVGTTGGLYRSDDDGRSYKIVLQTKAVNHIFIEKDSLRDIYVATDDGVYKGNNLGDEWTKIYDKQDARGQKTFCTLSVDGTIYIGTEHGLVYKSEGQQEWIKEGGELGSTIVYKLIQDQENIFALTDKAVFRLNKNKREITKIFNETIVKQDFSGDDSILPIERLKILKDLILGVPSQPAKLWLASQEGIFQSVDQGQTWQKLPGPGLSIKQVNSLAICEAFLKEQNPGVHNQGVVRNTTEKEEILIAATTRGVFYFDGQEWIPQYQGMDAQNVRLVNCSMSQWQAATDKGLYYLRILLPDKKRGQIASFSKEDEKKLPTTQQNQAKFAHEPSVQEVQRLAIRYADVSPEKISGWVRRAKLKAIVPSVSMGVDRNSSNLYHWDSGASPDQLIKGKKYCDWDVSLSWNLSDLVWNNDITSIDSRSKLSSELREDILAQVTRIYFERRRLQLEMLKATNMQEQAAQDLRLQELTALLDAFTNAEFSRRIENTPLPLEELNKQREKGVENY